MGRDTRGGYNRKKVNEGFFKNWNPKMAYVLGFMYADGSLLDTNESSRTFYLLFSNNDLPLLMDIRDVLNSDHKIYSRNPHIMVYKNHQYLSKRGYVLRIGDKVMYQDLVALGMEHKKSNIMTFPDVPIEYLSFFVRGYFDGDGCVSWYMAKGRNYPSLRVLFTSGSEIFLNSLSIKLSQFLNIPLGHIQKTDGAYNLIFQGLRAVIVLQFIYSNLELTPFLKYKYQKYLDYKNNLMGPRVKKGVRNALDIGDITNRFN